MNTAERWQRVSRILSEALDLPETDRGPFLAEAVRREPALRTAVYALLDEMSRGEPSMEPRTSPALEPDPHDAAAFGPYRVIGGLGEGGMGVVYLAERSDGQFTRQVAIKRVGSAAPGSDALRRFRDEREILARLDHPNIARLLDAGYLTHTLLQIAEMDVLTGRPSLAAPVIEEALSLAGTLEDNNATKAMVGLANLLEGEVAVASKRDPCSAYARMAEVMGQSTDGNLLPVEVRMRDRALARLKTCPAPAGS